MSFLRAVYLPLFRHIDECPVCGGATDKFCMLGRRLVYACDAQARTLMLPIPKPRIAS